MCDPDCLNSPNFGVQEWSGLSDKLREVFPDCPEVKNGYLYANNKPGLGIDIDEEKAGKYSCAHQLPDWTQARRPDGSINYP